MNRYVIEAPLSILQGIAFLGVPWLIFWWLRSRRPSSTPRPIVGDGEDDRIVPLIAAFGGVRGLTWIGLATNNLNPRLVLTSTGITYRLLRLQTRAYHEIEQVDVHVFGATVNLSFTFHGSPFTFDANVGSTVLAAQALSLLPGEIALSERAKLLVKESGPSLSVPRWRATCGVIPGKRRGWARGD